MPPLIVEFIAVDKDPATVGEDKAKQHTHCSAFAGSILSKEATYFTLPDPEG